MPRKSTKSKKPSSNGTHFKFRVGDTAKYQRVIGVSRVKIIEDRGHIGVNGRQLLRVQFTDDEFDTSDFEVPAEDLLPD